MDDHNIIVLTTGGGRGVIRDLPVYNICDYYGLVVYIVEHTQLWTTKINKCPSN